jgi:hypothetical protein
MKRSLDVNGNARSVRLAWAVVLAGTLSAGYAAITLHAESPNCCGRGTSCTVNSPRSCADDDDCVEPERCCGYCAILP